MNKFEREIRRDLVVLAAAADQRSAACREWADALVATTPSDIAIVRMGFIDAIEELERGTDGQRLVAMLALAKMGELLSERSEAIARRMR